ncbi:MAG: hypothetical protein LBB20_00415 [Puniceicoccales bacterium]|nr:hypothetical protein [Puniceicoccales bacterium]
MLSQGFINGMIIKKNSRKSNSNDAFNTKFIIDSILKRGVNINGSDLCSVGREVALPTWVTGDKSANGIIKILKSVAVKGKALASSSSTDGGADNNTPTMQDKKIENLYKLTISVTPGPNSEERIYTIYRYIPPARQSPPAKQPAS